MILATKYAARAVALLLGLVSVTASATIYTVTNTNDTGAGSLRQAIVSVNSADIIVFNIPGPGPYSINPVSPLQPLKHPVTIDGTTQPGYSGVPLVELNGAQLPGTPPGLTIQGGTSTVRGLAINRFPGAGIRLEGAGGNVLQGNFIGTDLSGTAALGNAMGIEIMSSSTRNQIGGTNLAALNLISGNNGSGIVVNGSSGNLIQGNLIGTDSTRALNLGNLSNGIYVTAGSSNSIGGAVYGAGNTIAFNGAAGVQIVSGTGNLVRANSIDSNGGLGIDLGPTGVTPNDPGDADTGANELQNYPVLTNVTASWTSTFIQGSLNSRPNSTFQIDYYNSPMANLSGFGEGKTYLGSVSLSTDANGNAAFHVSFPFSIPANSYVTATATDPANNTSEFGYALRFVPSMPVSLSVGLSVSSNSVPYGDQLAYSIVVTNAATNAASGVVVTDALPTGLQYVYALSSQGTVASSSNVVTFALGTVAVGSSATMQIYVSPQSAGIFTNRISVSANEYNLNTNTTAQAVVNVFLPAPPVITTQPLSQLLNLGGLLNLVVKVVAPPGVRYQWRLNGANIPGATNAIYSVLSVLVSDAGSYTVVVSDAYGAITSQRVLVSLGGLLSLPASDGFANRGLFLNLVTSETSNVGATSDPGEPEHAGVPGGKSVWFTWTPLLSGVATFSTAGSSFDTLLAVYTGSSLTNLTEVASDDDSDGFYTSRVIFNAVAGTAYQIAVDGAYGAEGNIVLSASLGVLSQPVPRITALPNDQVVGFGGAAQFSVQATGSSLSYQWYRNDALLSGATSSALQITNVSAAQVGLYTVRVSTPFRNVVSRPASLQINVLNGSVNGNSVAQDKFQATVAAVASALHRKSMLRAANLAGSYSATPKTAGVSRGYSSTQVFSTYAGGAQTGEPNHCGTAGGASSWASFQAADNGIMTMDTDGSNFDTILAVYTGNENDFSTLAPVACDVGSGLGGTNSLVRFAVTSNTVYYVGVDGVYGAYGTVVLNWSLAVPPEVISQPVSHTFAPGATATLYAGVSGHPAPSCQWWCNGGCLTGFTNSTLIITNFQTAQAGTYQMVAVNSLGAAVAGPASLLLNSTMRLDSLMPNATNHLFQMRLVGVANTNYVIQASTNLTTWITLATNNSPTGLWVFTDAQSTNFLQRFYRAMPNL